MYSFQKYPKLIFKVVFSSYLILILSSCAPGLDNKSSLSDKQLISYIEVYKQLRKKAPGILQKLNEGGKSVENGQDAFENFEQVIKEGGLEDYAEFVRLNAKIGAIFSIIQANKGMDNTKKLKSDSEKMFDDNIKLIEEQLADPDVPGETKKELKETIVELKKAAISLDKEYKKNEQWAKLVLKHVQNITGLIVDQKDIEVVLRHEDELMEAYIGFPVPEQEAGFYK